MAAIIAARRQRSRGRKKEDFFPHVLHYLESQKTTLSESKHILISATLGICIGNYVNETLRLCSLICTLFANVLSCPVSKTGHSPRDKIITNSNV